MVFSLKEMVFIINLNHKICNSRYVDLKCDESSMTGEPDFIKKNDGAPFMLSSCKVNQVDTCL
jgi:hypothetical protein